MLKGTGWDVPACVLQTAFLNAGDGRAEGTAEHGQACPCVPATGQLCRTAVCPAREVQNVLEWERRCLLQNPKQSLNKMEHKSAPPAAAVGLVSPQRARVN